MNSNSVTKEQIEARVVSEQYLVIPGTTVTICCLTLRNGFNVTGKSACADPVNFNEILGRKIARENALSKVWGLEGYLLKERMSCDRRPFYDPAIYRIAGVAHEINRAYCQAIGDQSQLPWKEAPEWQRSSAINGVAFHLENPDSTPGDSHRIWLKEKEETGWKYGPVKDPEKKEHPCFTAFENLPLEQQVKDYLFLAVVRAMEGTR